MDENMLSIKNLSVQYVTRELGVCRAVNNFSLDIKPGETIGLVGETGAGKTTVAKSILRIVQSPPGRYANGEILFKGEDILKASKEKMHAIRGGEISMIFQDPMTALNPIDRVGDQIAEAISLHNDISKKEAVKKACEMMEMVGIRSDRYSEYPHQFSGGMKQRIVIAIALSCNPQLLLADEPTTALDVTIQAQILEMMNDLKKNLGTAIMLITHDLGIVAEMCDRVAIMYAGEIVEIGTARDIFKDYRHPYTKGLFGSLPGNSDNADRLKPIRGLMPDPANLPPFCKFEPRCDDKCENCGKCEPHLTEVTPGHWVRCHLANQSS